MSIYLTKSTQHMQIAPHEIHIWTADLAISSMQECEEFTLLSADERVRANRFHFAKHKQRFVAARSMLRRILSCYLNMAPQEINFAYDNHNKPRLTSDKHDYIKFNLSHSDQIAVFSITTEHEIGIDIEKIQKNYKPALAQRFFSPQENRELAKLPSHEQTSAFYRIWSHKEAILKACGKGLSIPLTSFSISIHHDYQKITIDNEEWTLMSIPIHSAYQAAIASNQPIMTVSYWKLINHKPQKDLPHM